MRGASTGIGRRHWWAVAALVAVTCAVLLVMGRVPICTCGYVKPWHGVVLSAENSQHLADWYTFSHVIHGFAFYGLLWLVGGRLGWSVGLRLVLAVALEATWEIVENTPTIIDRYRAQTIALDYYGDSVVNSVGDLLTAAAGYGIAARAPLWGTLVLAIALELLLAWAIRDNLTLNLLMLIHPVPAIEAWQSGA